MKQVLNIAGFGVSSLLLLVACGQTSEPPPAVSTPPSTAVTYEKNVEVSASAGTQKVAKGFELPPGDYDLTVIVDGSEPRQEWRGRPRQESRGRLSLRAYSAANQIDESFGLPAGPNLFRLYGWTNVDFIKLGAPLSSTLGS